MTSSSREGGSLRQAVRVAMPQQAIKSLVDAGDATETVGMTQDELTLAIAAVDGMAWANMTYASSELQESKP